MTCDECRNYQPTKVMGIDIRPYIGKGYTLDEIIKLTESSPRQLLWDCPYSNDWCDADTPVNTLCDNKYEKRKITKVSHRRGECPERVKRDEKN